MNADLAEIEQQLADVNHKLEQLRRQKGRLLKARRSALERHAMSIARAKFDPAVRDPLEALIFGGAAQ